MNYLQLRSRPTSPRSVPWRQFADHEQATPPLLFSENDLHAMRTGMHCLMYTVMGAHPDVRDGAAGTRFAVWAPNAREVSSACAANHWQHGRNPLSSAHDGVWTGFVPGLVHGQTYKYSI